MVADHSQDREVRSLALFRDGIAVQSYREMRMQKVRAHAHAHTLASYSYENAHENSNERAIRVYICYKLTVGIFSHTREPLVIFFANSPSSSSA